VDISRGDLVIASVPGDYGKPRPVLVIQNDAFEALPSVTVLPLTSDLRDAPLFRITVEASPETGLRARSQIMADKAGTILRTRIGHRIGSVDPSTMNAVGVALTAFLALD
jgi:mRNA interferase MazF